MRDDRHVGRSCHSAGFDHSIPSRLDETFGRDRHAHHRSAARRAGCRPLRCGAHGRRVPRRADARLSFSLPEQFAARGGTALFAVLRALGLPALATLRDRPVRLRAQKLCAPAGSCRPYWCGLPGAGPRSSGRPAPLPLVMSPDRGQPLGILWTLQAEVMFYVAVPFLARLRRPLAVPIVFGVIRWGSRLIVAGTPAHATVVEAFLPVPWFWAFAPGIDPRPGTHEPARDGSSRAPGSPAPRLGNPAVHAGCRRWAGSTGVSAVIEGVSSLVGRSTHHRGEPRSGRRAPRSPNSLYLWHLDRSRARRERRHPARVPGRRGLVRAPRASGHALGQGARMAVPAVAAVLAPPQEPLSRLHPRNTGLLESHVDMMGTESVSCFPTASQIGES